EVVEGRLRRAEGRLRGGGGGGGGVAAVHGGVRPCEGDPGRPCRNRARCEGRKHGREGHKEAALWGHVVSRSGGWRSARQGCPATAGTLRRGAPRNNK